MKTISQYPGLIGQVLARAQERKVRRVRRARRARFWRSPWTTLELTMLFLLLLLIFLQEVWR